MNKVQIRNIVCAVDLSDTSRAAFGYASMLSQWYSAPLTVVELIWVGLGVVRPMESPLVVPPVQMAEYARELRQFVADAVPASIPTPEVVVREGPVVEGILDEARNREADLIVMGTHGRGGFDRLVIGSIAEKVLRKAACPVLTVPPAAGSAPTRPQPFSGILCAVDFSPASLKALDYAVALALESGKRLVLLHVFDWPADRSELPGFGPAVQAERRQHEEAALRELQAILPDEVRQWSDCAVLTAVGRPYEEIVRVAAARELDLVVLGVHGRPTLGLPLFGSTTNHVVRNATCPVLTVRS